MEWEIWRSREVVKAKKRDTPQGERYYTERGKQIPAEQFEQEYERIDDKEKPRA